MMTVATIAAAVVDPDFDDLPLGPAGVVRLEFEELRLQEDRGEQFRYPLLLEARDLVEEGRDRPTLRDEPYSKV
jgi:hypothetical protein